MLCYFGQITPLVNVIIIAKESLLFCLAMILQLNEQTPTKSQ